MYFSERWNCSPNSFNDIVPVQFCCMYETISFSTVFLPLVSFSTTSPLFHISRINCKRTSFILICVAISAPAPSFFSIYISASCSHSPLAASPILGVIIRCPLLNGSSRLSSNRSSERKDIYFSGNRKVKQSAAPVCVPMRCRLPGDTTNASPGLPMQLSPDIFTVRQPLFTYIISSSSCQCTGI